VNVLYLNHSEQVSGAEQSLRALLWEFRREHSEVEPVVALPGTGPFADMLRAEEWNVTFAPMRRIHRPNNLLGGMATLMHVLRTVPFITRLVHQTDSELIHSNSTTAHLVGGLAGERTVKPAIWHARDLVSLERIAPALAQRAAWVVAISGCVAERLQSDGVPPEKIRVIHNGLNPDEWNPRPQSQLRENLSLDDNSFLFGCVAQLVPWKNQEAFIDAAAQICRDDGCGKARFAIIGGNLWGEHREYLAQLRERVKSHNMQDRFNFVPHQMDNVDAISALDALVLPSHEEPFGRVLLEGMSLRKPVIAYAENGPLEIISHAQDGLLVQPDEENGLANAMRRVLHEPDLREHLARHSRETVMQKFHIADSAQRVRDLYREVLT
jgi:glycosyltransferase involved in cell wall biosynthesis